MLSELLQPPRWYSLGQETGRRETAWWAGDSGWRGMTGKVEGSQASLELLGGAGHSGASCDPANWEMEAGGSGQGYPWLHSKVRAILGYIASFGIHETLYQ